MAKKTDDNFRNLFEEIQAREAELAEMRKQASDDLRSQLDQVLSQMDQYGVELPQSLISRVQSMHPTAVPREARGEGNRKQMSRAPRGLSKNARPAGIPEEARFCKVCGGWTDHDTRSHRQEKPAIQRKLKYGQPEQSGQPRLVRPDDANA